MILSAKTAAAVAVWTIARAVGGSLFFIASPALEARLAPVLVDQRIEIDDADRSPGRMCWTWHWTKRRYPQPVVASWSISIDGTAVEIPAVTERERDRTVVRNPQTHTLGPGRNDLCVSIPDTFDRMSGLTIRGYINYRLPHGLWTMWQELQIVRVPPLP